MTSPRPATTAVPPARHGARSASMWMICAVISVIGLAAEAGHYSWRDGRSILSADSVQYLDSAEALVTGDRPADFALRKPGYPLMLAALSLLGVKSLWAIVAVNHVLLGLLPLVAFGIGTCLHSRGAGCVAAVLTMARLQLFVGGDRIMSESLYMFLLVTGVWTFVVASKRPNTIRWIATAGVLFAIAWLVRSVAIVAVVGALTCTVWYGRHRWRQAIPCCLALSAPLVVAVLAECSLNQAHAGQFRTSTGSLGMMMMMRTRHFQGLPMSDSEAGRQCLALLPDRTPQDAFRASELDTWVARYRGVHKNKMDDWEVDHLMRRAAVDMIARNPVEFARCSADVFARYLTRRPAAFSYVSPADRRAIPTPTAAAGDSDYQAHWYDYWALPHRTPASSVAFSQTQRSLAEQRAPFAKHEPLPTLRYATMLPSSQSLGSLVRTVARLWPGFALILCGVLGLDRRACLFLAVMYLLEAGIVAVCCPSDSAFDRYQSAWLVTDSTLTACVVAAPVYLLWTRWRAVANSVGDHKPIGAHA